MNVRSVSVSSASMGVATATLPIDPVVARGIRSAATETARDLTEGLALSVFDGLDGVRASGWDCAG